MTETTPLSTEALEAIRGRDQSDGWDIELVETDTGCEVRMNINLSPSDSALGWARAHADRRALLLEIDRLRERVLFVLNGGLKCNCGACLDDFLRATLGGAS